ncbi:hypothetical protein M422DRAFT_261840 [Sphaerobolus stellatus SS14]|uniref:C2H2-type domain-containing protein n=1 Tax=Sphaerobolus stellatus (strain SS14) TaxID=990650 RepID=A0A0C9VEB4_SPHS4|nr:hypothetical protein M422DRAFT_261840 [Sphaerobolus stellatus SS14]
MSSNTLLEISCWTCNELLRDLPWHMKRAHGLLYEFKWTAETHEICGNTPNDPIHCPISECPTLSLTSDGLKRHLEKSHGIPENSNVDPPALGQNAASAPPDLVQSHAIPYKMDVDVTHHSFADLEVLKFLPFRILSTLKVIIYIHDTPVPTHLHETLHDLWCSQNVLRDAPDLVIPSNKTFAIPCLPIHHNGYVCAQCDFCAPSKDTVHIHWGDIHRITHGMFQEGCFLCGDLQTIFQHHIHYFQVAQPPPDKPLDPYHLFVTQTLPKLGELPAFNLLPTDHELSPLLRQIQWHEYLQDAMKDPYIVSDIIQTIQIPKNQDNLWTKALHQLTNLDLDECWSLGNISDFCLQKILVQWPDPPINGKAWCVLDNKEKRHDYGCVVQSIYLGVLHSLELPQRLKWFGVDAGDIA